MTFPPKLYVRLRDENGIETLEAAFAPEDFDGDAPIAVYEIVSVGQIERRFVTALEHSGPCYNEDISGAKS